jgi:uncharacterized membrane protein
MEHSGMSKERLEAFSDAVFAVALTLLVLEIHVPEIAGHSDLGQYAAAMAPLVPKFESFALTFVIICIHWVGHHYFFRHLRDVPLGMLWLNNLFLFWICVMPFPTAMLGDHPVDQFPIILYAVNQLCASLNFLAFRSYARKHNLFKDAATAQAMGPGHSLPAIALFTLSIVLAFVNIYLSLACLVIVPLLYFVPNALKIKL